MKLFPVKTKPFLASVIITALYFALFLSLGAFAINPGVGEGSDLDPTSFRFRAGELIDHKVVPILAIPFLPGIVLRDLMHLRGNAWDPPRPHA